MDGCPFSKSESRRSSTEAGMCPVLGGRMPARAVGDNEQGNSPKRDVEKQLLPLMAKFTRPPCPPGCPAVPQVHRTEAPDQGYKCSRAVLRSGDVINIFLRDKFSQKHFKSSLVSSNK